MKTMLLLFWVLIEGTVMAQEPYRYLVPLIKDGVAWVQISPEPMTDKMWLEDDVIKTVNFRQFITASPAITQPEGFYLIEELDAWKKSANSPELLNKVQVQAVTDLAEKVSGQVFGECLADLERDKYFLLWLSVTRAVVESNYRHLHLAEQDKVLQTSLTSEWVWDILIKSWTVSDVRVFYLQDENGQAINLLVDAGANIMTKLTICPELYYKKKDFSYDLVTKSSKDLKHFVTCKK